jgi:hypothetical protein
MFGCILKFEEYFGGSTSLTDPPKYSSKSIHIFCNALEGHLSSEKTNKTA